MIVELYSKDKHYNQLSEAWIKHGHKVLDSDILPKSGFVVTDQTGLFIAAIFVYFWNDANVAQIAWATTNPIFGLKKRHTAINTAIEYALYNIRKNNKTNVFCFSKTNSGLSKMLNKRNIVTSNVNHVLHTGVM